MATLSPNLGLSLLVLVISILGISCLDFYFTGEPHDAVVTKIPITSFILNCSAINSTNQTADITWLKDNRVFNFIEQDHIHFLVNGSLFFDRVRKKKDWTDEGKYQCMAHDKKYGTLLSREARLTIPSMARKFQTHPKNTTSNIGEIRRFNCEIKATPAPQYSWDKDQRYLKPDNRITILDSGVLIIRDIKASDAGRYRCKASNQVKQKVSEEATLTVIQPQEPLSIEAQVKEVTRKQKIILGERAVLECIVNGLPLPQITWSLKGKELEYNGHYHRADQGVLVISSVNTSDSGTYTCAAIQLGRKAVSKSIVVDVLTPPQLDPESSSKILKTKPTYHVRLEPAFTGKPRPRVWWTKDGEEFIEGNGDIVNESMLVLRNAEERDRGVYQCWAQNDAGVAYVTYILVIQNLAHIPDPPQNVRGVPVGSSQINLTWSHDSATIFSVHYSRTDGSGSELQKAVSETNQTALEHLDPNTKYTIYMKAFTEKGGSKDSAKLIVTTGEDVPGSFQKVNTSSRGQHAILVSWKALDKKRANGIVLLNRIHYRIKDSKDEFDPIEVPAEPRQHLVQGLQPNTKYEFLVQAATKKGFGPKDGWDYAWVVGETKPAPFSLSVRQPNATSAHLSWSWSSLQLSSNVYNYSLAIRKVSDGHLVASRQLNQHITGTDINQLDPEADYDITLIAYRYAGEPAAVTERITTYAVNSTIPLGIVAKSVNDTVMRVIWSDPPLLLTKTQKVPVRYTVKYMPSKNGVKEDQKVKTLEVFDKRVTLEHLTPFTTYWVSVRSTINDVHSEFSRPIPCSTKEGKPSSPVNPEIHQLNETSVQLKWQSPSHQNGVIHGYIIQYGHMESPNSWTSVMTNASTFTRCISNLQPNTKYGFRILAKNGKSNSDPTSPPLVVITPGTSLNNEKELGIIIGICVGLSCILICVIVLLCTRKRRCGHHRSNRYPPNMRHYQHPPMAVTRGENHELDSRLPMLTNTTILDGSSIHIDTKGGGNNINGFVRMDMMHGKCLTNGAVKTGLKNYHHTLPDDSLQTPLANSTTIDSDAGYGMEADGSLEGIDHDHPIGNGHVPDNDGDSGVYQNGSVPTHNNTSTEGHPLGGSSSSTSQTLHGDLSDNRRSPKDISPSSETCEGPWERASPQHKYPRHRNSDPPTGT